MLKEIVLTTLFVVLLLALICGMGQLAGRGKDFR